MEMSKTAKTSIRKTRFLTTLTKPGFWPLWDTTGPTTETPLDRLLGRTAPTGPTTGPDQWTNHWTRPLDRPTGPETRKKHGKHGKTATGPGPDPYHGGTTSVRTTARTPHTPGTHYPYTGLVLPLHRLHAVLQGVSEAGHGFTRLLLDTVVGPEYRTGQNHHF